MQFLYYLFLCAVLVQCGYCLWYLLVIPHLYRQLPEVDIAGRQPVSVIICARNEAANLDHQLRSILCQDYRDSAGNYLYEVVVVNDASEDNTQAVLERLQQEYSHLKTVTVTADTPRTLPGKKFALGMGLQKAQYDCLLLIDADCCPMSDQWLALMTAPLQQGKEIVAGYGAYKDAPGWLNKFIRWETVHTFLQYSTYAYSGLPYMAVGRNLACTRQVLEQAAQTEAWSLLPSGDDDLLVRSGATASNIAVVAVPQARTMSYAKENVPDWISQKQRHVSTGKLYKPLPRLLLGLYGGTHALSWFLGILLICAGWAIPVLCFWFIRTALLQLAFYLCCRRLGEPVLKIRVLACDFGWAIYNFALSPYIFLKNKQKWT